MSPQDKKMEEELFNSDDSVEQAGEVALVTRDGYDFAMFVMAFADLFNSPVLARPSPKAFVAPAVNCSFTYQ